MHIMFIPSWYSNVRNKVHGSFFKEQALELQKAGVKVTVAYNEVWPLTMLGKIHEEKGLKYNVEDGLKTYRYKNYNYIPKNPLMFKVFNKRMEKLYKEIVKKEGVIDIIHAQSSLWGGISAAYIAEKYNIPLVITEHSSVERGPYVKKSYIPFICDSYKKAQKVITVGNGLKNEIESLSGRQDIEVIGNLVDLSKFTIKKRIKNEKFIFFSLAFLEGEKGFDTLIKSFAKKFKDKEAVLYIGGDGSQRSWLEALTVENGVKDQIIFLGALSRDDVSKWMNKCDCFVLPSRYETFGVVYIEALASGRPVIGALNGGAEDIINNLNGYLIPIDDIDILAEKMIEVYDNIESYDEEEIRIDCLKRFSPKVIVNKIISVYKEVLKDSVKFRMKK
ncbi:MULTISPECIES: glycosyltransferase [Clostridia]|uniref:Glycosyltransferase n=3 Tax=Clostridia TaxID=186801 RepID=A0A8I0ACJ5_9CLOT|nr:MULTISPECIES: glycosyltransferase [Clostridia]MBC5639622.1 glycosyltransferase [Clostridium lentum]MBC5653715.1 glycosyltransferase [Blautia lenta]CDB75170.1 glycosyl transferase [Clostridium sp. CAG:265]